MQSWDNQSRNQSRNFARRRQSAPDRNTLADQRWVTDGGGGSRTSYDSPSYGNSYDRRTDNDEFSSYDREGRYDRSERSQYAGSQSQYDRQNASGWGEDGSPNDETDYRSNYQGFTDRDRSQDRYGYGRDLDNGRRYGSSRKDWGYTEGDDYEYGNQFGRHSGKGPKGFKRSDERIKEDISEILTRHPEIDASDIEIEVKDGDVTLSGVVPERSMKHMTEDIVERCMGVHDIQNQLRVKREDESAYGSSSSGSAKSASPAPSSASAKKSSDSSAIGNH